MRQPVRLASAIALLGIVAPLLASCTVPQRISVKSDGDSLTFAVCEEIQPNKIVVESVDLQHQNDASKRSEKWVALGDATLSKGDRVKYGVTPAGFTDSVGPKFFVPTMSRFSISFVNEDEFGNVHGVYQGVFDGSSLREHKWLNQDGNLTDRPCE